MRNYLSKLSPNNVGLIRQIGELADQKHTPAYMIGGVVRDLMLGRHDVDLDIMIEGDCYTLAAASAKSLGAQLKLYKEFKTATLLLPNGKRLDLSSSRKEKYSKPGALPSVAKGNLIDDLSRRDFTINTMAIQINQKNFGNLIDRFGGVNDLKKKKVRILHKRSFIDDPTRIFRAIRFEQRFTFKIEPMTLTLLRHALRSKALSTVSMSRLFNELVKMFNEKSPYHCLKRAYALGVLNLVSIKNNSFLERIKMLMQNLKKWRMPTHSKRWLFYFMATIEDHDEALKCNLARQFQLTREDVHTIMLSSNTPKILKMLSKTVLPDSAVFEILEGNSDDVLMYFKLRTNSKIIHHRIDHYLKKLKNIKPSTNGHALQRLGVRPGQNIGQVYRQLLLATIDGKVSTLQEEKDFVLKRIK